MQLSISEILERVSKADDQVQTLRQYYNPTLAYILKLALDPTVKWILPEGAPNYRETKHHAAHTVLYGEQRKLYLFLEGGSPGLKQHRREQIFINMLESVEPRDAKLLLSIKDKKLPVDISVETINTAFPGLITVLETPKVEEKTVAPAPVIDDSKPNDVVTPTTSQPQPVTPTEKPKRTTRRSSKKDEQVQQQS